MCTRAVSPPPSYTHEPPLVRYSSHVAGVAASSNVNEEVKEISAAHGVDDVNSGGERAEERTALFEEPGYPSKITSQASSDRELFRKMSTYMRIYIASLYKFAHTCINIATAHLCAVHLEFSNLRYC